MPIGIIINALSIVIGGILGALVGHKLSPKFKEDITLVFGVCSMGMAGGYFFCCDRYGNRTCDSSWRKD